jgi:hypothetical protein
MTTQTADKTPELIRAAISERQARRSGKSRARAIISAVILTGLSAIAVIFLYPGDHSGSAPLCDGAAMSPGDICNQFVNGSLAHSYSYQQMLARQQASHPLALVFGIIGLAAAVLVLALAFTRLSPGRPWGKARPGNCPQCQQPALREKLMVHIETRGRTRTTWRGIVTLCTPECGLATVRQPDPR